MKNQCYPILHLIRIFIRLLSYSRHLDSLMVNTTPKIINIGYTRSPFTMNCTITLLYITYHIGESPFTKKGNITLLDYF